VPLTLSLAVNRDDESGATGFGGGEGGAGRTRLWSARFRPMLGDERGGKERKGLDRRPISLALAREAQRDDTSLASGVEEGAGAANEQRGFREVAMGSEARDARRLKTRV